jgi:hypothetical protein
LRDVLLKVPNTYSFSIGKVFRSALGQATALDENVNRPGKVAANVKKLWMNSFCRIRTSAKT